MSMRERMAEARISAGLSQGQAALMIGVSRSLVEAWETGARRVRPDMLEQIASVYGVSERWLETGETAPPEVMEEVERLIGHLPAVTQATIRGIVARAGAR